MKQRLKELKDDHYRIIYLDETIFTTKTIRLVEYTKKSEHLKIPLALTNQPVLALIFAMSAEKGVEEYAIYQDSINQNKFAEYLVKLRRANEFQRIAIFFDNLSVHRTRLVKEKLE